DARNEDEVLRLDVEFRQQELHGGEDRIVPAPGAPADLLVRLEVLAAELHRFVRHRASPGSSLRSPPPGTGCPGPCSATARRRGTRLARAATADRGSSRARGPCHSCEARP